MRTIKFNNEDAVDDIARRAYRIQGDRAEELGRRAERALLDANPHLESLEDLERGATILVPDLPGLRPSRRVKPLAVPASSGVGELTAALDRLQETVTRALDREVEDADSAARVAAGRRLRNRLKKEAPEMIDRLDEIVANAKDASKEAKEAREQLEQAATAAQQDLSELKKKLA